MSARLLVVAVGFAVAAPGASSLAAEPAISFSGEEKASVLAHGPWPLPFVPDPSNRVSGMADAIALGRRLFFDKRLSRDQDRACTTCHDPDRHFADGRVRSSGLARTDRNAIALANLRLARWFGWSGAADSLWMQSLRPILDPSELGATAQAIRVRLSADADAASAYATLFGARLADEAPELMLVNLAKALAAFQETIVTRRTSFDGFRDALAAGNTNEMAHYPAAAQRGLKIFVGKGRCSLCHHGPNFTNGEFDDIGVPFFVEPGRVDSGRFGGLAALRASAFNQLGAYNDDPARAGALQTRHAESLHRNWGEFRVPSLRNVARTGPYMHNGSFATLQDVVRHYSEVDVERLHGDDGGRTVKPLHLSQGERADLVSFLESLTSPVTAAH
jgi:cytochrome c peroxidase